MILELLRIGMDGSIIFLLGLVGFAVAGVLPSKPRDKCKDMDPEVYCQLINPTGECHQHRKTRFCKYYLSLSICKRGPRAYCTIAGADVMCERVERCKTWPDDSVTAVKIITDEDINHLLVEGGAIVG